MSKGLLYIKALLKWVGSLEWRYSCYPTLQYLGVNVRFDTSADRI